MYSVTFQTNGKRKTRKYQSEARAHKAMYLWFEENKGTATFYAPYQEPKLFTDNSELEYAEPKKTNFYLTGKWKRLRHLAFERYGNKCACCGATPNSGAQLHVDHIKPRSKYPELELDINNLQILCSVCNEGKSNLSSTDWNS